MADPFNDDTDYDFSNLPGGYKEQALALSRKQAESETSAMDLLRQSMQRSAEVSPSQGLAASLLAAVPTLGGYIIGKSVGTPDIGAGEGMKFGSFDEYKKVMGGTGGFAGGLAGVEIGSKGSGSYLKGLDEAQAAKADVLQKQASLEAQTAARAGNDANQMAARGLAQADQERMIPLQEQSQIRVERERAKLREESRGPGDPAFNDPLVQSFLAKKSMGLEPTIEETMAAAKSPSAFALGNKAASSDAYADSARAGLAGEKLMPPSPKTKEAMSSALQTKSIGERYINKLDQIAATNPSYAEMNITKLLPTEEIGKLQQDLGLFAVQLRNAREAGVMTDRDEARYREYLTISPLDTLASVRKRMQELQDVTDLSVMGTLKSAKAGNENTKKYEALFGIDPAAMDSVRGGVSPSMEKPAAAKDKNKDPAYLAILERKRKEKGL